MASYEYHCKECQDALGDEWGEVHIWLDELFKYMGPKHRSVRHHSEGVEECRKRWGDEGAKAAELHIRTDWGGKLPTKEECELMTISMVMQVFGFSEQEARLDGTDGKRVQGHDW